MSDWNTQIVEQFRANGGEVGGQFAGAPMTVLHHVGRRSGKEFVTPLVYQPDAADPDTIYLFASAAGAPDHPDWYRNLIAAGTATAEVKTSTDTYRVEEVTGPKRDAIYAEQVTRMPGFAEYEEQTQGIRTIPVLALRRVAR
jgi:deazaflavin-dependent oxidoreductase (nitroreductase family)